MDRSKLLAPLVVLLSSGVILGLAQDQLTIDASKQPSPPARERGPFPSSMSPGHSTHLPIRLELRIPSGPLQPDGTTPVDFVITNIGNDVISLPSSIKESDGPSAYLLTLWFTSDAVAIEDCHLLPGIPVPIFAAVAGPETKDAIRHFRDLYKENKQSVTFVALVVGNWIRIRGTDPRCPIPMARGIEHLEVKQAFVDNADEVFVISPLGKIFVGKKNEEINAALGFSEGSTNPDKERYGDVVVDGEKACRVKLVTTSRAERRLLHSHSVTVGSALTGGSKQPVPTETDFGKAPIENVPHLFFPFDGLPHVQIEELIIEFPHKHTRSNAEVLEMFDIRLEEGASASRS